MTTLKPGDKITIAGVRFFKNPAPGRIGFTTKCKPGLETTLTIQEDKRPKAIQPAIIRRRIG